MFSEQDEVETVLFESCRVRILTFPDEASVAKRWNKMIPSFISVGCLSDIFIH